MLQTARLGLILAVSALSQFAAAAGAQAQARDTVASMRTRYNTVKTQAKPQGDLKAKLDALDQDIARAARLGKSGELRRLYTRGITLAAGREWTPEVDFATSLALRTDHVFVDTGMPIAFQLGQSYAPALDLSGPLSIHAALYKPPAAAGTAVGAIMKDMGRFDGVGRDLIDEPFRFEVDLAGIPDGRAIVRVEVLEGSRTLGAVTQSIEVHKGLHERLRRLEAGQAQLNGFEELRAEVLYPLDYIRNVDRGRIAIGQFDFDREVALAESALSALKMGKDPFTARTGDFKRHYFFDEAGEIMPYRLYVPSTYTGERAYPLIIALHGNGGTENTFFDGFDRQMTPLAQSRGYIIAAPLGYRVDGAYGYNNGSRPAEDRRKLEFSERDVMNVLELMKRHYTIDENRIYLVGHSMGGSGTWYLGPKYPENWAALASFAGGATPETAPQVRSIPQFVVHGDADATVPVERSRDMVAELNRLGVPREYVEVAKGSHGGVVAPNLRRMFDFFDRHRKTESN